MDSARSDISDQLLDADEKTEITVRLPDGSRRRIAVTKAEADGLGAKGERVRGPSAFATWGTARGVVTWTVAAVAGALIASYIGGRIADHFADQQMEVEIEAALVQEIKTAAMVVYEEAQSASNIAGDPAARLEARERAANTWVETSHGQITPLFEYYYGEEAEVTRVWYRFQDAAFAWAVMACCTKDEGSRSEDVRVIRDYVESQGNSEVGESTWNDLIVNETPPRLAYQEVGQAVLRVRPLMDALREATPQLDLAG